MAGSSNLIEYLSGFAPLAGANTASYLCVGWVDNYDIMINK